MSLRPHAIDRVLSQFESGLLDSGLDLLCRVDNLVDELSLVHHRRREAEKIQ